MAKVNLGQTRLSHMSESYTLPEYLKNRIWRYFLNVVKKELLHLIE